MSQWQSQGKGVGFQRIRRVTGDVKYLTNVKQIEVSERVPHASVGTPSITPTILKVLSDFHHRGRPSYCIVG